VAKKPRNYAEEYARRIARARARGLSRSQARGHARPGEASIRQPRSRIDSNRFNAALKALNQTGSLIAAAKSQRMAPESLRRFLRENALAERRGRTWRITDNRQRQMTVISDGDVRDLILRGFDEASLNGRHLAAVRHFLSTNDIELLLPFEGLAVTDAKGRAHPLETDPNTLHRLAAAGSELFHEIYRLIV
jgi:hypothetical protein